MEGLEVVAADASGTGQAALVLGIIALLTCWCPFVGLLPGIIAIILAVRLSVSPRPRGAPAPRWGWSSASSRVRSRSSSRMP
jgi:hypothetical protein